MGRDKGFAVILLVTAGALIILGAGGYLFLKSGHLDTNINLPTPTSSQKETAPTNTLSPTSSTEPLKTPDLDIESWKDVDLPELGVRVKIPTTWDNESCPSGDGQSYCEMFGPTTTQESGGQTYQGVADIIDIDWLDQYQPISDLPSEFNYTVPALGASPNAYLRDVDDFTEIVFKYKGTGQYISIGYRKNIAGYHKKTVQTILDNISKSLSFIDTDTCKGPTVLPPRDFPNSFELLNYHDSDGSDLVTDSLRDNVQAKPATLRSFIVSYIKSGPVMTNQDLSGNLSLINPASKLSSTTGTSLIEVNCPKPDLPEDNYNPGPIHLTTTNSDPYGLEIYGKGTNAANLWAKNEWNIDLLKQTRNEVYIKMGNNWQKYSAINYSVYQPSCCFAGKPAIYLYPEKTTQVQVEIHPQGQLLKTDSLYDPKISGWLVQSNKDGKINNNSDYLYYEAWIKIPKPATGYVVSYDELIPFMGSLTKKLGLNEIESTEFVNFWQTKLDYSPYYFVSYLDPNTINTFYPLSISPKPDNLLRVEVYFKPLKSYVRVNPPTLPQVTPRSGFTAVEWGGVLSSK